MPLHDISTRKELDYAAYRYYLELFSWDEFLGDAAFGTRRIANIQRWVQTEIEGKSRLVMRKEDGTDKGVGLAFELEGDAVACKLVWSDDKIP